MNFFLDSVSASVELVGADGSGGLPVVVPPDSLPARLPATRAVQRLWAVPARLPQTPSANWKAHSAARRFFVGQVAARFFLNHRELIDEHPGQLEIHFAFAGLRIRNLPEKKRGVLRLHHDKLDEALRKLAGLRVVWTSAMAHFCFAAADPSGGRTVART